MLVYKQTKTLSYNATGTHSVRVSSLIVRCFVCVAAGVLYYVSSTVNPILYNVMSRKFRSLFRRTLCGVNGNSVSRCPRLRCCCRPASIIMLNCNIWHPHPAYRQPPQGGIQQSPGSVQAGHRITRRSSAILLQQVPSNHSCLEVPRSPDHEGQPNLVQSAVNSALACSVNHLLDGRRSASLAFHDRALQQCHQQPFMCHSETVS